MDSTLIYRRLQLCFLLFVSIISIACPEAHAISWFPFGPDGGDARGFAADPRTPGHLYLGTANGWIYQTQDGGKQWTRLARVGKRDDLVLDNIVVDPVDPKHIVVGAHALADLHHPDGGLYISNDSGATWTAQTDMRGQSVLALTVAPSDPKIMVAGSMEGVFRSTDGGAHWKLISQPDDRELHEVESIAIDPSDPNTIYAGTWHLPWKTTDGGAHWKNIKEGIIEDSDVFSIIIDPKQPSDVYLSACSGIYKSDNSGEKFAKVQGIPTTARRTRVLMQDPNNLSTVFAGTTEGLYRSDDGGKVWVETTGSEVIVNDVYVDPSNSKHVLIATDRGGVRVSNDGGFSFVPANSGFSARQITAYTADAQHPATLYVGVVNDKEWGGVFVSHTGGLGSWSQLSAGLDGRDVFSLGQAPDNTILAGTEHGIYRLDGVVWKRSGEEATAKKPLAVKPDATLPARRRAAAKTQSSVASTGNKNFDGAGYGFALTGNVLFAATSQGLLRSASSGLTWSLASGVPQDEYHSVAAAKNYVVAATLDALEMSPDSGQTWQAVTLPAKVKQVKSLAVDGQGGIWVGWREGVSYSPDKGASWRSIEGLYLRNVDNIYYEARAERMLITSEGSTTEAFAVQLPTMRLTKWDTGWNLRFLRPVGDYLIAATLFDGIVVQPKMVDSPLPAPATAQR